MENDLSTQKTGNYSINIHGKVNGMQIQQGAVNSSQTYGVNQEFDYNKASNILDEISKYTPMFADTYGKNQKIAEAALTEARECVSERGNPSKLKHALSVLKDVSLRASSSLIATGVLELLKQIGI